MLSALPRCGAALQRLAPFTGRQVRHVVACRPLPSFSSCPGAVAARSFHGSVTRLGPEDEVEVSELPDFAGDAPQRDDDYDPTEDRMGDKAELREAKQAAKELGVGGQMSKQDRMALKIKRKRAHKALTEESKHGKARVEKMKEKSRKAAALKAAAAVSDSAVDEVIDTVDDAAKPAAEEKPLDKNTAKALNAAVAAALPKTAPGVKLSPSQIAANAKIAAAARAAVLAEQSVIRVNEKITAAQITLIGVDGKKLGTFPRQEAFRMAQEQGLDLLQVSPAHLVNAPAACKMLNYKLHKSLQERREKDEAKARRQVQREVKAVQVKAKIAGGDLQTKIDRMRRFLAKSHPVKLSFYVHSGVHDPEIFLPIFETCVERLLLDGSIEPGTMNETKPYLNFSPITDKKRALMYPRLTDAQKKAHGVYLGEDGTWRQKGRKDENDEDEDEDEDEEEDEDEDEEDDASASTAATPTPAKPAVVAATAKATPAVAAAAAPASAAAAAAASGKKEKHKKTKPTYVSGPALFSRAALKQTNAAEPKK